jgi:hypothetical protein
MYRVLIAVIAQGYLRNSTSNQHLRNQHRLTPSILLTTQRRAVAFPKAINGTSTTSQHEHDVRSRDGFAFTALHHCTHLVDDDFQAFLQGRPHLVIDRWRLMSETDIRQGKRLRRLDLQAEMRLTPPRRARRRMAGLVTPWMLSRKIFLLVTF